MAAFTGEHCYVYGERRTVRARNVTSDPRVVLHLGDVTDVAIVHRELDDVGRRGSRQTTKPAKRAGRRTEHDDGRRHPPSVRAGYRHRGDARGDGWMA